MKVSIIIRSYNAQDTVDRAIKSALGQSMPKGAFEIVVIDDGSTDGTRTILETFASQEQVHLMTQRNQGGTVAANNALAKAKGTYCILLDDDDILLPSSCKELSAYLDAHPDVDFVYPDYYEQRGKRRVRISPRHLFEALDGGVMIRRQKLLDEGGYVPGIIFAGYDLFLRTLQRWKGVHIKKPLYIYTRHQAAHTANPAYVKKGIDQLLERFPHNKKEIATIRSYEVG